MNKPENAHEGEHVWNNDGSCNHDGCPTRIDSEDPPAHELSDLIASPRPQHDFGDSPAPQGRAARF